MYNLFLDDTRFPQTSLTLIKTHYKLYTDNSNWEIVRTYDDFVNIIQEKGMPDFISFDHDLGSIVTDPRDLGKKRKNQKSRVILPSGMDCAKWLVEHCMENEYPLPEYQVHSANPIGAANIRGYLENFKKHF